jgi:PhnB protein
MARVSIYLNFMGKTEEAFNFYKQIFGTEFNGTINRMKDVPPDPSRPPLAESEGDMVMHVELPILGGGILMGTDMLESMGHKVIPGNNVTINLEPDTKEETERIFTQLLDGGSEIMPLQQMFWGDLFGSGVDRFGTRWMFNFSDKTGQAQQ